MKNFYVTYVKQDDDYKGRFMTQSTIVRAASVGAAMATVYDRRNDDKYPGRYKRHILFIQELSDEDVGIVAKTLLVDLEDVIYL